MMNQLMLVLNRDSHKPGRTQEFHSFFHYFSACYQTSAGCKMVYFALMELVDKSLTKDNP